MKAPSRPPNFDKLGQEQDAASFTSWKLDLINALLVDPRLKASDFKVAVAVLQFMNSKTGMIFPSQETIAEIVHVTPRHVGNCLNNLRLAGWLLWKRGNRQLSNVYEFDTKNLNAMLDYRTSMQDGRRERAARRKARSDTNHSSSQKILTGTTIRVATGTTVRVATGTTVPSNTYREHLQGTPEQGFGIEDETPIRSKVVAER